MNNTINQTNRNTTVTDARTAYTIFSDFCRNSNFTPTTVPGSRAKYYKVRDIVSWYSSNNNVSLNSGWFGRSLNKAVSSGMKVTVNTVIETNSAWHGKPVRIYRNSK